MSGSELRGTVQNDILKEYVARGNYIFPPRPSMRITTDLFAYCDERLPRWNTISISGYHIREAGSTAVQELGFTLAHGIAYCEAAVDAGLSPDEFGERLSFFFNAHNHFFQEVAKFRAARTALGAHHARPLRSDESQGAGAALPRADGRLDAHRPAAGEQHRPCRHPGAVGSLRRCAVDSHERLRRGARAADPSGRHASRSARSRCSHTRPAAPTPPTRSAARTSSRALTRELEERAWALIERVDEIGGAVAAIEQGFMQHEIEDAAYEYEQRLEGGDAVLVGVNRFVEEEGGEEIELHRLDPEAERRQIERTERVRADRDAAAAEAALARVREAAGSTENLLPPMREALALHCTVGEICNVLREEFGTYDAHHSP